jgi:hypothetical protein
VINLHYFFDKAKMLTKDLARRDCGKHRQAAGIAA